MENKKRNIEHHLNSDSCEEQVAKDVKLHKEEPQELENSEKNESKEETSIDGSEEVEEEEASSVLEEGSEEKKIEEGKSSELKEEEEKGSELKEKSTDLEGKSNDLEEKSTRTEEKSTNQKPFVFGQGFKLPTFGTLQTKSLDELVCESTESHSSDQKEEIFHTKEILTGEEEEETIFSARGKLFTFDQNEWKERGVGTLKLNRNKLKETCRLLMRTDGSHRLILNAIVFKDFSFELVNGKNLRFGAIEEGKPATLLFRSKAGEDMDSFNTKLKSLIKSMH